MNTEKPEPPEGYRLLTEEEKSKCLPFDAMIFCPDEDGDSWIHSAYAGHKIHPYLMSRFYATRTPIPATGGEKGEEAAVERATCTLCCKVESSGFFTGCMIRDIPKGEVNFNGWQCDGDGNLTRPAVAPPAAQGEKDAEIAPLDRNEWPTGNTIIDAAIEKEQQRWQEALESVYLKEVAGHARDFIDGGGCDSGDPLDFTISEVQQAFGFWQNRAFDALSEMGLSDEIPKGQSALEFALWVLPNDNVDGDDAEVIKQLIAQRDLARAELATVRAESAAKDGIIEGLKEAPDCDGFWVRIEQLKGGHLYPRLGRVEHDRVTYDGSVYHFLQPLTDIKWWKLPTEWLATTFAAAPEDKGLRFMNTNKTQSEQIAGFENGLTIEHILLSVTIVSTKESAGQFDDTCASQLTKVMKEYHGIERIDAKVLYEHTKIERHAQGCSCGKCQP